MNQLDRARKWGRPLLLVLLLLACSPVAMSGPSGPHLSILPAESGLPDSIVKAAAADANQIAGTHVQVKTMPGGDPLKVLVTTDGDTHGCLAETTVLTFNNSDPSDDECVGIVINLEMLKKLFPGILDDPDLLRRILGYLLSHEFDHVPSDPPGGGGGQGGNGHGKGTDCNHLADYVADCTRLCTDIQEALADESLKDEDKCKLVAALCKLHKHIRDIANKPINVQAAQDCPNVTLTNGLLVTSCTHCPMGDCPVHGHDFGGR